MVLEMKKPTTQRKAGVSSAKQEQPTASDNQAEENKPEQNQEKKPAQKKNLPLAFELKKLCVSHPFLQDDNNFPEPIIEHFEAGYCSAGMMRDRIAIPIHNLHGELLAYAGRSATDRVDKYPPKFDRTVEIYNVHRAVLSHYYGDYGLIVVPDFFDVWRVHESGFDNAVALMDLMMTRAQEELLAFLPSPSKKLTLFLPPESVDELLQRLTSRFFVRVIEDEGKTPSDCTYYELSRLLTCFFAL